MIQTENINLPILQEGDKYSKDIQNQAFRDIDREIKGLNDRVKILDNVEGSIIETKEDVEALKINKADTITTNNKFEQTNQQINKINEQLDNNMQHIDSSLKKYVEGEEIRNTFFEDKTYDIDTFKLDGGKCVLMGNGKIKTTIKSNSTVEYLQPFQIVNKDTITIKDLTFETPCTPNGESVLLIKDSSDILIENITLITTGGYSIYFENCTDIVIKGCKLNKGSLWFKDCENVIIDGNTFKNTFYDSVKAQGNNFKIINNNFIGSQADAIDCYTNGQNVVIANNYIENCSVMSIQLKSVIRDNGGVGEGGSSDVDGYNNRVLVANNIIKNSPYGVNVKLDDLRINPVNNIDDMPKYIKIIGNLIENCNRGIYGKHVNLIEITNNTIITSSDRAVMFSESFYNCVVSNNLIENCKDAIYMVPKTTTSASNNKIENNKIKLMSNIGITYRGGKTTISNNSIENVAIGIQAMYSTKNIIKGNSIIGATTVGIDLTGNYNYSIFNSNIIVDSEIGLRINGSNAYSIYTDNVAHNNTSNFVNNSTNTNNSVITNNINIAI